MAKKKAAAKTGINISQEIRDALTRKPTLSAKEVLAEVQTRHPGARFNEHSFGVSFSAARKQLGLSTTRKTKVKKPAAGKPIARKVRKVGRKAAAAASAVAGDLSQLQGARDFVARCGSAEAAIAAIRQLQELQI